MAFSILGITISLVQIHVGALFLLIPVILFADHEGFSWIRGKKETLNPKVMLILHRLVWAGLGVMIVTGAIMFWPLKDYLLYTPAFYIKMFFVLVLVINSFFINRFMKVALERPYALLTPEEKKPLFISGAASTISWIGAVIAALGMQLSGPLTKMLESVMNVL